MPGDISRDFASSLSKLHYEVAEMKRRNQVLEQQVEELTQIVKAQSDDDSKKQRARVLRAAASQDAAEIDGLIPQTTDVTEVELLRAFKPVEQLASVEIQIDPSLLENFRQATVGNTMPTAQYEEPLPPVPYILSEKYKQDNIAQMRRDAELTRQRALQKSQVEQALKHKEENNLLRRLSPLWKLPNE